MEQSWESTTESIPVFDADHFDIHKFSRWANEKGQLLVVTGFYHGNDPRRPFSHHPQRVGLELLTVSEERAEYMDIHRFIYDVINNKIRPWMKAKAEVKVADTTQEAA